MIVVSLFLTSLASLAGAVPVPPDKQAYVGEWTGNGVELSIGADGSVSYKQQAGSFSKSLSGKLIEFVGPSLRVDALIIKGTVTVDEPPHEDRGVWVMTVGGAKVLRKPPHLARHQRAEAALRDHYKKANVAVTKVVCTADADRADSFACVLMTELGDSFIIKCVADAAGDMSWKIDGVALLDSAKLVAFIERMHADKRHEKLTAHCPAGMIMKRVGSVFTCDGVTASRTYKVSITVKDVTGNVSIDY